MNLIAHIEKNYGAQTAIATEDSFDNLRLALPEDGEFTINRENHYLLFLNSVACVIRISPTAKYPPLTDPAIQRPLATVFAENLRININPGMKCPVDPRDTRILRAYYKNRGLLVWDDKIHNFGYRSDISQPDHLIPVLIDEDAVEKLSASICFIKRLNYLKRGLINAYLATGTPTKEISIPQTLEDPYEDLRITFEKVWGSTAIDHFWREAATAKQKGRLIASWLTRDMEESGYKNAYKGSVLYEERWQRFLQAALP